MVISSRGLARLLFLLVLSGFPFISIFSEFLHGFGNTPSISFRICVLTLSFAVFLLSVRRARITAGYTLLLIFMFFYAVRLVADIVLLGPQLVVPSLIFFFGATLAPTIALATSGYDGTDERFFAKWLVYMGMIQCAFFSGVWLAGAGYNSWAEFGEVSNRLALERLNPISVGHAAITTVIAAAVILTDPRTGRDAKIVCYFAIALAAVAFLSANSRGPALAGVAAMFWLFGRSLKRSFALLLVCVVAIGAAEYFTGLLSSMLERFTWDIDVNDSNQERVSVQIKAISAFVANPFFGAFSVDPTGKSGDYPHNIFIEAAMGMGVFGLALIFSIVYIAWRKISNGLGRSAPLLTALFIQKLVAFQFSGAIFFADAFFVLVSLVLVSKVVGREFSTTITAPQNKLAMA